MYEEVEAIFKDLKYKTLDEKRMIKGLQPQRADVITAGVNILKKSHVLPRNERHTYKRIRQPRRSSIHKKQKLESRGTVLFDF
jgi:hypothetical protein